MNEQLSIFSNADDSLKRAIDAVRNLDLEKAGREISAARRIDPYAANLEAWEVIIGLLAGLGSGRPLSDFLAETWRALPEKTECGILSIKILELIDREIAEIALRHIGRPGGFLDAKKTLHWGFVIAARGDHEESRTLLMETLTDGHAGRADLWAGYASALWSLGNRRESTAALVRALVLNPAAVDLRRTRIPELRTLYEKLLLRRPPSESRALLLFSGWIEGLWEIRRPVGSPDVVESDVRKRIDGMDASDRTGRLTRFSLCFYLDKIRPPGEIDIEARERMMEMEPELFRVYMEKVGRMQRDMFL
jgi:tetratricopeptide (TPR) repeat protein